MGTKIGALRGFHAAPPAAVKNSLTIFLSSVVGLGVVRAWSVAMLRQYPHSPISNASRRRLARWLVGSPVSDVERDLVLEPLVSTHGNRTAAARTLGMSVRTLRNKITEYSADGIDVPPPDRSSAELDTGTR